MDCDRRCDDNDKGKINVIKVKELKFIVLNWQSATIECFSDADHFKLTKVSHWEHNGTSEQVNIIRDQSIKTSDNFQVNKQ